MDFVQQHKSLFIVEGILFILLGILAIALPGLMTLGLELLIGWLFIIGGIVQGYRTFKIRHVPGFYTSVISALLSIGIGIILLMYPLTGMVTLTILLIAYFLIDGVVRIATAFQLRSTQGWGWLALSGAFSLALGVILWSGWPETIVWGLGLLVGINMLFFGCSLLTLALSSTPSSTR